MIVLNLMHCDGAPLAAPPAGVPPSLVPPAALNTYREGCMYWPASVAPGAPTLVWDRYSFFVQRWQWSHEQRWEAMAHMALFLLAYRVASTLAWRLHYGRARA